MASRKLGDRVARGVDQSIDAGPGGLMKGAADFEVERRYGIVCGSDVRIKIGLSNISREGFTLLLCGRSASKFPSMRLHKFTVCSEYCG